MGSNVVQGRLFLLPFHVVLLISVLQGLLQPQCRLWIFPVMSCLWIKASWPSWGRWGEGGAEFQNNLCCYLDDVILQFWLKKSFDLARLLRTQVFPILHFRSCCFNLPFWCSCLGGTYKKGNFNIHSSTIPADSF